MRFCAHMAILLMLHNRISVSGQAQRIGHNTSPTAKYNQIVREYIYSIADSKTLHEPAKLEAIPFYIAMLIGELDQREAYARVMVHITDDSAMTRIRTNNEAYFTKDMCTRILHSVPHRAIYWGKERDEYLQTDWHKLRDHILFVTDLKHEDHSTMEVLMWLQTQDDLSATIGFYVELARKFLSELKLFAAKYLLTDFMAANFGEQ